MDVVVSPGDFKNPLTYLVKTERQRGGPFYDPTDRLVHVFLTVSSLKVTLGNKPFYLHLTTLDSNWPFCRWLLVIWINRGLSIILILNRGRRPHFGACLHLLAPNQWSHQHKNHAFLETVSVWQLLASSISGYQTIMIKTQIPRIWGTFENGSNKTCTRRQPPQRTPNQVDLRNDGYPQLQFSSWMFVELSSGCNETCENLRR